MTTASVGSVIWCQERVLGLFGKYDAGLKLRAIRRRAGEANLGLSHYQIDAALAGLLRAGRLIARKLPDGTNSIPKDGRTLYIKIDGGQGDRACQQ